MHLFNSNLTSNLLLIGLLVLGGSQKCDAVGNGTEITSDGCVDKSGFETCIQEASSGVEACLDMARDDDDITVCLLLVNVNQMNCYMSSCWNHIYGCEYQYIATEYSDRRGLVTPEKLPFWPAPDNAPGGCSCNFGNVFDNSTKSLYQGSGLCTNKYFSQIDNLKGCTCCAFSASISAFFAICPQHNLYSLGLDLLVSTYKSYDILGDSPCSSYLDGCVADYGVAPAAGGTFLDGQNLPTPGDQPFSTTGAAVTSPPGGPTVTWSVLGTEYTVVALSYDGSSNPTTTGTDGSSATGGLVSASTTGPSSANSLLGMIRTEIFLPFLIGALWLNWY